MSVVVALTLLVVLAEARASSLFCFNEFSFVHLKPHGFFALAVVEKYLVQVVFDRLFGKTGQSRFRLRVRIVVDHDV